MGFLDRIFGKKRAGDAGVAADLARSRELAGRETGISQGEKDATRSRMEADMDAQRERRQQPPASGA